MMLWILVILPFVPIVIYTVVFITAVKLGMSIAGRKGMARWKGGLIGALIVYLPVFWDHIPTYLVHQYYCLTEVDFQINKTPEQWKAENPGVAETLTWSDELSPRYEAPGVVLGRVLNERFVHVMKQKNPVLLPISISYDEIIDVKTNDVMAISTRVGSGYGQFSVGGEGAWKFWVGAESCFPKKIEGETIFSLKKSFKTMGIKQ
ncbi:MAG: hypothetical protein ABW086_09265 [Sedimenticola sp.]